MAKDPREYGFEGEMAMSQLKGIMQHAESLHGMLKPDTDLPEWVQSKITLAYDYMQTAADYMSTEMKEEVQIDELSKKTLGNYIKSAKKDVRQSGKDYIRSSQWGDDKMKQDANKMTDKRYKGINMAVDKLTKEEAPVNAVGGGNIHGIGVGSKGEPGVSPKAMKNYKAKNAAAAHKAGRKSFSLFIQGK